MSNWLPYAQEIGKRARSAAQQIVAMRDAQKSDAIRRMAAGLRAARSDLLAANVKDVSAAEAGGLDRPLIE